MRSGADPARGAGARNRGAAQGGGGAQDRAPAAAEGQERLSVIATFPPPWDRRPIATFERQELSRILDLYGRMVSAGHWRDYALRIDPDLAVFAAYRRHSERPDVR